MPWIQKTVSAAALKRAVDKQTGAACSHCEAPLHSFAHRCGLCNTLNDAAHHGNARRFNYPETPAPWVDALSAFLASGVARDLLNAGGERNE